MVAGLDGAVCRADLQIGAKRLSRLTPFGRAGSSAEEGRTGFAELELDVTMMLPNQGAAANRRPALRLTMTDNLNIFTAFHARGPAVAELGR